MVHLYVCYAAEIRVDSGVYAGSWAGGGAGRRGGERIDGWGKCGRGGMSQTVTSEYGSCAS
jgi:hypothetical protein